jgi:hypothetical protein
MDKADTVRSSVAMEVVVAAALIQMGRQVQIIQVKE